MAAVSALSGVAYGYTWEAKAGGPGIQGQPGSHETVESGEGRILTVERFKPGEMGEMGGEDKGLG